MLVTPIASNGTEKPIVNMKKIINYIFLVFIIFFFHTCMALKTGAHTSISRKTLIHVLLTQSLCPSSIAVKCTHETNI
jgi:hypothetical protein